MTLEIIQHLKQLQELYLGHKLVVVLLVNRTVVPNRLLIGNRKHKKSRFPIVQMVDACELAYRPTKLIGRDHELNSLKELMRANGGNELIDWEPGAGRRPKEFQPTDEIPGTIQKVEVLAHRLAIGFPLWHPHDATFAELGKLVAAMNERLTAEIKRKTARMPGYVPKEHRVSKTGKTGGIKQGV